MDTPIVELTQFIKAIRDAGYKGTSSALAELVDNAFEADANSVSIDVSPVNGSKDQGPSIIIQDDGTGMTPAVLRMALQFGGSSHFGSRRGTGRYGMGLPNSSVSQAKRLEVYTWAKSKAVWWSYLDVDEISEGKLTDIPTPARKALPKECKSISANHGTVIKWTNCDRLSQKRLSTLMKKIRKDLGRIFRIHIWQGKSLRVNGEPVKPIDPLFLREGDNLMGARLYGAQPLKYDVKVPMNKLESDISRIRVTFTELPVEKWFLLSNFEKRSNGISKKAGVSILRVGREIDYGWYFMGSKRKENYDDWWRCEIEFSPELDELFGVTHTKQGITPSEYVLDVLTPDLEQIAHRLNARVRAKFSKLKEKKTSPSERRAIECDLFFEPPELKESQKRNKCRNASAKTITGLDYKLVTSDTKQPEFYESDLSDAKLKLILNEQHPFFERFYHPLTEKKSCNSNYIRRQLELVFFAAVRAEKQFKKQADVVCLRRFRKTWSNLVAAFLA